MSQFERVDGADNTLRTPTDEDVAPEVFPLREEGDGQQRVEVEALHQQPEEARHDAVMEENHHCLAARLEDKRDAGDGADHIPPHREKSDHRNRNQIDSTCTKKTCRQF